MKIFFIAAMLFSTAVNAQNKDFATKLMQLSEEELLETAKKYVERNSLDTALICYNLIIKTPAKADDIKQQERIARAYISSGGIYTTMGNYLTAYELLLKALAISEKYNFDALKSEIYLQFGNIYIFYYKYDMAKTYYTKALNMTVDSLISFGLLLNIVAVENEIGTRDSSLHYINKAMQMTKGETRMPVHLLLTNIAVRHFYDKMYDSSFYYLRKSLEDIRSNMAPDQRKLESKVTALLNTGILFYEINQTDSAVFYLNSARAIATEYNFPRFVRTSYLYLSKIEEKKGNIRKAFEHHKTYSTLNDSLQSAVEFGKIAQFQRLYEVSKTNWEIEQHIIDKQIKDNTIYYQKIILYISLFVLLLISAGLVVVYLQKRNLNRAYHALFKKNIEIENLEKSSEKCPEIQPEIQAEIETEKAGTVTLTAEMQRELLQKVLTTMDDKSLVCDPEFTIDKLAAMIQSNRVYVSHVINACLKKNFRTLLNGYRIGEAKRILAEADIANYSIGYVAGKVGYKSQSTFFDTFKEVTGITPKFYLKSIQAHIAENQ